MMKRVAPIVILISLIVLPPFFMFRLNEGQQAVITVFGKPKDNAITEPGLKFRLPWWTIQYFEKRILRWDGDASSPLNTAEQTFIYLDTTARWKIVDPLTFLRSVKTVDQARLRLDDIIDSVVRNGVSNNKLIELVRDSNRDPVQPPVNVAGQEGGEPDSDTKWGLVETGRTSILHNIIEKASLPLIEMGIELIDVRIKRLNYVESVEESIFDRMIAERNRIAQRFRSEGQGAAANIIGGMERELKEIRSEAYRKAQEIEGQADAEATRIYADAFNRDPDFYAFLRTMESYQETLGKHTKFITTTKGDYFRYLKDAK